MCSDKSNFGPRHGLKPGPKVNSILKGETPYKTQFSPGLSLTSVCDTGPFIYQIRQPISLVTGVSYLQG